MLVEGGRENDGWLVIELFEHLKTVEPGKIDVQKQEIGIARARHVDRAGSVGSLADDLELLLERRKQPEKSRPRMLLIFNHDGTVFHVTHPWVFGAKDAFSRRCR